MSPPAASLVVTLRRLAQELDDAITAPGEALGILQEVDVRTLRESVESMRAVAQAVIDDRRKRVLAEQAEYPDTCLCYRGCDRKEPKLLHVHRGEPCPDHPNRVVR